MLHFLQYFEQDIASAMKAKIGVINHKKFQLLYLLNPFFLITETVWPWRF